MFREEVHEAQKTSQYGQTLKVKPLKYIHFTLLITLALITAILFIAFSEYARKETVYGHLVPEAGMTTIKASTNGIVTAISVQEGQTLEAGNLLFSLTDELLMSKSSSAFYQMYSEMMKQKSLYESQIVFAREASVEKQQHLASQIEFAKQKIELVDSQSNTLFNQLKACRKLLDSLQGLKSNQIVSEKEFLTENKECFRLQGEMNQNALNRLDLLKITQDSERSLNLLDEHLKRQLADIHQLLSVHQQKIFEKESQYKTSIAAPMNGTIISLRVKEGDNVQPGQVLAIIAPFNYKLQAHLFIPTKSIAFALKGQKVKLKYDAYPFERYGWGEGTIVDINDSVFRHDVIPIVLNDNSSYYRAKVNLASQTLNHKHTNLVLKNGMQVIAEIPYDKRALWQWIFKSEVFL